MRATLIHQINTVNFDISLKYFKNIQLLKNLVRGKRNLLAVR